jgi:glucose/arabinose dehydrogenase
VAPFLDISEEVGAWHDHGFLGFALHPNFNENGYVYLLYLVDRHHLLHCQEPAAGVGEPVCDATYDPAIDETFDASLGRLTRYQARLPAGASDYAQATEVDPSSRTVFIGRTISSGIPSTSRSHVTGSLVFATDGTLFVTTGDGARSAGDAGSSITTPDDRNYTAQALADGILDPAEDVGSNRAQMLDSLSGKILRLDPLTGQGVASNPYFNAADPDATRSKVWGFGLRNPFRASLKPGTGSHNPADGDPGTLIIGDVGRNAWEEINVVETAGQNFGWPLYEGMDFLDIAAFARGEVDNPSAPNPLFGVGGCTEEFFQFRDLLVQDTLNTPDFPNPCNASVQIDPATPTHVHTRPILAWRHGIAETRAKAYDASGNAVSFPISDPASPVQGTEFSGSSVTGGIFYTGTDFPAEYQGNYFFADFTGEWMRRLTFDAAGNPVSVELFSDEVGGVVSMASNPVSNGLYYISWTILVMRPGAIFRPKPSSRPTRNRARLL